MPEGDSVAGHARELASVLVGREIESVYGTSGSVRSASGRLLGHVVTGVRAKGKNLLIDFDSGWSVWVHLGMTGRWRMGPKVERPPGDARLALTTSESTAVCRNAPTVAVDRTPALELRLERLGPDVLDDEFDSEQYLERARSLDQSRSVAEMVLDQQVVAGIGNVYKSEILFLEKINPKTPVGTLDDGTLVKVAQRAVTLMRPNVGRRRSTTGDRSRDRSTWVYGRGGKACRRCESRILSDEHGGRYTYWCSGCQPA